MNIPLRVLIVEDSEDDSLLLKAELARGGYDVYYERVETADAMRAALEKGGWDIILSDHRMPQFSSIAALAVYNVCGCDPPFIVVSGSIGEELAVSAMKAGAHDYIMKDNLRRLRPAVERELREAEGRRRRREAEAALGQYRRRSESILDAAGEGICGLDADGIITFINPRGAKLVGWQPEELIAKSLHDMLHHSRGDHTAFPRQDCSLCATLRDGLVHWIDSEVFWRKDGSTFPVEYTCTPMRDGNKVVGAVLTFQDVTQRKGAEAALRESNRQLAHALTELRESQQQVVEQERLRALGQMAGGVAHDFNNALSKVLGFTELLLTSPDKLQDVEKVRDDLRKIKAIAQDATSVVHRLREFYRPRRETEQFELVDLNTIVEQVIPLMEPKWKSQAQATGADIDIRRELQSVPPIAADEVEMREVLTNLIFNAVDAMPHGGTVTLRTRVEGDQVVLEVSDTGVGMTNNARQRCFEPFFTTKGEAGTGLGLSMAYGIIGRHRGTIQVQSEQGKGTTLTIRLPVHSGVKAQPPAPKTVAAHKGQLHVLVVEDEPMIRQIESEYLKSDGHVVETAADGREGLRKFRAGDFDLVLVDRAMPEMNGDQLADAIKDCNTDTPVILVTGFGETTRTNGEKPPRVDLVLPKPFSRTGLREAVQKVCVAA